MKSNERSGWTVEFAHTATNQLDKLDPLIASRIFGYLRRLETDLDPTSVAKPLKGSRSMLSRLRVGDYRVICKLDGESFTVLVLCLAHRKKIYHMSY